MTSELVEGQAKCKECGTIYKSSVYKACPVCKDQAGRLKAHKTKKKNGKDTKKTKTA